MFAQQEIGQAPIGAQTGGFDSGGSGRAFKFWVDIDFVRETNIALDSLQIDQSARDSSQCNFTVLNPSAVPDVGSVVEVVYESITLFGGLIRRVTLNAGPDESVKSYSVEARGWEMLTERRLYTRQYNNRVAGGILHDMLLDSGLNLDGVEEGFIDDGISIILADAQHVRLSDFIRDIGDAGGSVAFVNEVKKLIFRVTNIETNPLDITNASAETISRIDDMDDYRNRQTVKCTSLDGTVSVEATRDDLTEQAARIAQEGGTGVYQKYDEVKHPTSNSPAELTKYAISVAFLSLQALGSPVTKIDVRTRSLQWSTIPYRVGEYVSVNFPGFAVGGLYQIMRRVISDTGGEIVQQLNLWSSNVQQAALESLLRIVRAAKASVIIPGNLFSNSVTFTSTQSWNVPGSGPVELQIDAFGGGGGGSSGLGYFPPSTHLGPGAAGGKGGKATTFKTYTAGTTLQITIGSTSTGGTYLGFCPSTGHGTGTDGGLAKVDLSGVLLAQGDGGIKGGVVGACSIAVGASGGGTGDFVTVGGAENAGAAGAEQGSGGAGGAPKVTIYY